MSVSLRGLIVCVALTASSPACVLFTEVTYDGGRRDAAITADAAMDSAARDAAIDANVCPPGMFDCAENIPGCETRESETDCGRCGRRCSYANAAGVCTAGVCSLGACESGYTNCDGNPTNGCETRTVDSASNCGGCGRGCAGANPTCANGQCGTGCPGMGQTRCGATCVDTLTDNENCGMCDLRCGTAPNGQNRCTNGTCRLSCNPGFADCNGAVVDGCEVQLGTTQNCGSCGNACSGTTPVCDTSFLDAMGRPSCRNACAGGTEQCMLPGSSTVICANTMNNPQHCGACNTPCAPGANQSAVCASLTCNRACTSGFADCNGNVSDGCETQLNSITNCLACGTMCSFANAAAACGSGGCAMGACNSGFGNCDGMPINGCETPTSSTLAHCGACGRACASLPNATVACVAGACAIGSCNSGFLDCDGNAANGCEVNTNTDTAHCGRCGNVCPAPLGSTAVCALGTCSIACPTDRADCNGNAADGCEALLSGGLNCGRCGVSCIDVCSGMGTPTCRPGGPDGYECACRGI